MDEFTTVFGFSDYEINRNGVIRSKLTGKVLTPKITDRNYVTIAMVDNDGKRRHPSIHRLLCMTFKAQEAFDLLTVDHVNNNHADFRLENLEWVTLKENIQRAEKKGLRRTVRTVAVRNVRTGEVIRYPSKAQCALAMGLSIHNVVCRTENRARDKKIWSEGFQYRFETDPDEPWFIPDDPEKAIRDTGTERAIQLIEPGSGKIITLERMSDALGIVSCTQLSGISLRLSRDPYGAQIHDDGYRMRYYAGNTPWPLVKGGQKRSARVVHLESGKTWVFKTCAVAARHLGCSPTYLHFRLNHPSKSNQPINGCTCEYVSPEELETILRSPSN